jgi:hypothetical protein
VVLKRSLKLENEHIMIRKLLDFSRRLTGEIMVGMKLEKKRETLLLGIVQTKMTLKNVRSSFFLQNSTLYSSFNNLFFKILNNVLLQAFLPFLNNHSLNLTSLCLTNPPTTIS